MRRAGLHVEQPAQFFRIDAVDMAVDRDLAEMIERAFLDRVSQREAFCRGIVFRRDRAHIGVGITLGAIIGADQLAIGIDHIGIVDVAAEQKTQHVGSRRLDDGGELAFAKDSVAGEVDLPDRRLGAFGDLEDEIDTVAAAIDEHGFDRDVVTPETLVSLDDVVDVGLHGCALQASARLGFDRRRKLGVFDALVALEDDFIQHWRLVQVHDQFFAGALDRHVFEQMRSDQRFQRRIPRGLVEMTVGRGMEIRAHGRDIDALVAFDFDGCAGRFLEIAGLLVAGRRKRRHA
jgi:hypothetical protein